MHRSPFDDSLVASGSDDGKVKLDVLKVGIRAHKNRLSFGESLMDSLYARKRAKNPRTLPRSKSSRATQGNSRL